MSLNARGMEREPRPPEQKLQYEIPRFTRTLDEVDPAVPETKEVLGGKGLGLVELTKLGISVPPAIIATTGAWCEFHSAGNSIPDGIWTEITNQLHRLEEKTNKSLEGPDNPLIVSVRSGAPISMPGAMQTILNVGLNDRSVQALAREIGECSAWEAYFELMASFGTLFYEVDAEKIQAIRRKNLQLFAVNQVNELPLSQIKLMVCQVKTIIRKSGHEVPDDPYAQIKEAVSSVFRSWENPVARQYRERFRIPDTLGTACIIQQMVWGNRLEVGAGAGVFFSRDPKTLKKPLIDFAPQAQGPKVVGETAREWQASLKGLPFRIKEQLITIAKILENHYRRPQEIEFTYDGTKLWILQTRDVHLSGIAWFRYLRESVDSGRLTLAEAQRLIDTAQLQSLLAPGLVAKEVRFARNTDRLLTIGISVSLGTASAPVVRSIKEAQLFNKFNKEAILVGNITMDDLTLLPDNVVGVVAENGSIGSHIARVATRIGAKGIPIIFGAKIEVISSDNQITINGATGEVFRGVIPTQTSGSRTLLVAAERAEAQAWLNAHCRNPWRFSTHEEGVEAFTLLAQEALHASRQEFASPKAHAAMVINQLIPAEMRMDYKIIKPNTFANMGDLLIAEVLKSGDHATVRSCYTPDRRGRTPWFLFTQLGDVQKFFDDSLTGFRRWIEDPELTEMLVGKIPKDKLSPDPAIQQQHCAWTLTCTEMGDIILQVRPGSPQLRGHEQTTEDDLVSFIAKYDPKNPTGPEITQTKLGTRLKDNPQAWDLTTLVYKAVFQKWWVEKQIPQRMAAVAEVFPKPDFPTPVLEGQARLNPAGGSWCLVYGMKIDIAEEEG